MKKFKQKPAQRAPLARRRANGATAKRDGAVSPIDGIRKNAPGARALVVFATALCALHASPSRAQPVRVALTERIGPIEASEYVEIDGARLYVEIRGDHADAPLLVWLHGGPGGAERPLFRYFNSDLERHFLVAYLDQRGAGRSFDPDAPAASLNIAQHIEDLGRVVDRLRSQFRRDRVLLVGHSWGAALGMLYAKAHPEKVSGLICVAPVVSINEQLRREYDYDTREASRREDGYALGELHDLGPPPYQTPALVIRLQRVTERYGGVEHQAHNHAAIVVEGVLRGLVTPWEIFSGSCREWTAHRRPCARNCLLSICAQGSTGSTFRYSSFWGGMTITLTPVWRARISTVSARRARKSYGSRNPRTISLSMNRSFSMRESCRPLNEQSLAEERIRTAPDLR